MTSGYTRRSEARGAKSYHEGTATPFTANNPQPVINGFATCTLPAGWFVVPLSSDACTPPRSAWSVSDSYDGNATFLPITKKKSVAGAHGFPSHPNSAVTFRPQNRS
jgi:hypothetical protein